MLPLVRAIYSDKDSGRADTSGNLFAVSPAVIYVRLAGEVD